MRYCTALHGTSLGKKSMQCAIEREIAHALHRLIDTGDRFRDVGLCGVDI